MKSLQQWLKISLRNVNLKARRNRIGSR